jgi:hypothetical protein
VPFSGPAKPVAVSVVPSNVKFAESVSRPPAVLYTTRPEVKLELVIDVAVSEVNAPVLAVLAPTVPFSGPAKPVAVSVVPLNVRLAESVSRPPVVEKTTRPVVRPELVIDVAVSEVNAPVLAVLAPTVPFSGPAKPVEVRVVPLNVRLAESVSRPPAAL